MYLIVYACCYYCSPIVLLQSLSCFFKWNFPRKYIRKSITFIFWIVFFWTFLSFCYNLLWLLTWLPVKCLPWNFLSIIKGSPLTFLCVRSHFLLGLMSSSCWFIPLFWRKTSFRNSWENSGTRVSNTLVKFQRTWMFREVYLFYHCSWLVA